jgi:hypothetical protein
MTQDPEHAAMLLEAQESAERDGVKQSSSPPMHSWSAEMDMLATIADRVGGLGYILRAVNGDKKATPPPAVPRPETLLPKLKQEKRKQQHKRLAARLLGRA